MRPVNLPFKILFFDNFTRSQVLLYEIDTQCYERVEFLVEQMKAGTGITEALKAYDQMKWVGLMNNVRSVMLRIIIVFGYTKKGR